MDELVGVVIPTFNRPSETLRAVHSVLNQSLPVSRIIVVDDGSDSFEITTLRNELNALEVEFVEIRHTGNPAKARNVGLRMLDEKYVAFLDSDDYWERDKIEKQLKMLRSHKAKAISSNAKVLEQNSSGNLYHQINQKSFGFNSLLRSNKIICSSVLLEREILLMCGGFSERNEVQGAEDYATWLRVAQFTDWVYLSEPLVTYSREQIKHFSEESSSVPEIQAYVDFLQWRQAMTNRKSIKLHFSRMVMQVILYRWHR